MVQEFEAALCREHHPRLYALGCRIALNDLQSGLRVLVVVVSMLLHPSVGLGAQIDAWLVLVALEAVGDLSRDVPSNSLYRKTGRGHRLGETPLVIDVPQPVRQRLNVSQYRPRPFREGKHVSARHAEPCPHPQPMLGM